MRIAACTALLLLNAAGLSRAITTADLVKILDRLDKELLEGTFTAKVAITTITPNGSAETEIIEEFHDGSIGIHAITHSPSGTSLFYYDHLRHATASMALDSDESVFVRYNETAAECNIMTAAEAGKDPKNFMLKHKNWLKDKYYLGPTSIILDLPRKNFNRTAEYDVRGIEVDSVVFKLIPDENHNTDDVFYVFFPAEHWTMHVLAENERPLFPVRITKLSTDSNNNTSTTLYDFFQVHDLTSMELYRTASLFQLPFKNGCELPSNPDMDDPPIGQRVSFVAALEDKASDTVSTEEWYDLTKNERLSRCDSPFEGSSVIRDDKHGVKYTITDTCVSKANDIQADEASGAVCSGLYAIRALGRPKKYYIGETMVRGIPADVWEAIGDEDVVRLYYTKPNINININGVAESQIPLRVERKQKNVDQVTAISLYDYYSTSDANEFGKNFNIEDCQREYQYIEMVFHPDATYDVQLFKDVNAVEQLAMNTRVNILRVGQISSLRLAYLKLDVQDDGKIIATAKILTAPDYLTSFTKRKDKYTKYDVHSKDSLDAEACAKRCVGEPEKCATILYCSDHYCFMMPTSDDTKWGNPSGDVKMCRAYDRSDTVKTFTYRSLEEVVNDLGDKVNHSPREFESTVQLSAENKTVFTARDFQAHVTQFDDRDSGSPYHLQFDSKTIDVEHPASHSVKTVGSVRGCYRECVKDMTTSCASFSVCVSADREKGRCVLSSLNIHTTSNPDPEQTKALKNDTRECGVYSINYLQQFEHVPGKIPDSDAQASAHGESAGDCAADCRQSAQLKKCHGFDFCPKTKKCRFYEAHYAYESSGTSSLTDSQTCDHYALHFASDYTPVGKYKFKSAGTPLKAVSLDKCAKRCSEGTDNKCKSLAYCNSKEEEQTCYMYDVDLEHEPAHETATHCTMYMRHKDVADIINPTRQDEKTSKEIVRGMGDGSFAGLLIAMTLVGFLIGSIGFLYRGKVHAVFKRSSPAPSTANTTITYNRQQDDTAA